MSSSGSEGENRLVTNVVSGWIAHGIALVVGFVMPRLIDESIGQAALGVWDLGWSLTSYLTFSGLGMAAAITHEVARVSDSAAPPADHQLRQVIATGFYCQLGLAFMLGLALTSLFVALPAWAPETFGAVAVDMQWVGIYLGLTLLVGMTGDVAQGVLTGYHRTSWNEYLTVAADLILAVLMIVVLVMGGGIKGLALVTLLVRAASELLRFVLAWIVCPNLSVRPLLWCFDEARALARFAIKTSLGVLQDVVVHQGVRVMLAVGAGPSALACYSRYQTIIRQISRLMERSARVIPPMTSALAGQGRRAEIDRFRERAAKASVMASLPMIVVFAVFGDQLILLWMGRDFVVPGVSWILALMALLHVDYGISSRVLVGMNWHGRVAAICFTASLLIFGLLYLLMHPLGVIDAAWVATVAMAAGVSVPHYFLSCARLETPPWEYFKSVYLTALLVNGLFLAGLMYSQLLIGKGYFVWGGLSGAASVLLLSGLYWHVGMSQNARAGFVKLLRIRTNT